MVSATANILLFHICITAVGFLIAVLALMFFQENGEEVFYTGCYFSAALSWPPQADL